MRIAKVFSRAGQRAQTLEYCFVERCLRCLVTFDLKVELEPDWPPSLEETRLEATRDVTPMHVISQNWIRPENQVTYWILSYRRELSARLLKLMDAAFQLHIYLGCLGSGLCSLVTSDIHSSFHHLTSSKLKIDRSRQGGLGYINLARLIKRNKTSHKKDWTP